MGSSCLSNNVWSTEDGPNFARRFCLVLVIMRLVFFVMDVLLEVPITDEFFDLILEHATLLCGVADILVTPTIFILIIFGAVSLQWVRPLVCSVAKKTSSLELVRSVKFVYLLERPFDLGFWPSYCSLLEIVDSLYS